MKRYAMQNRNGEVFPLAKNEEAPAGCQLVAVIPVEDREQVERLAESIMQSPNVTGWTDRTQAALREFANPAPPKPDEPQGKWAIVTAFGLTYCRAAWATNKPWSRVGTDAFASWDELDVESIESEGVS